MGGANVPPVQVAPTEGIIADAQLAGGPAVPGPPMFLPCGSPNCDGIPLDASARLKKGTGSRRRSCGYRTGDNRLNVWLAGRKLLIPSTFEQVCPREHDCTGLGLRSCAGC
jgi:hypothetical protein